MQPPPPHHMNKYEMSNIEKIEIKPQPVKAQNVDQRPRLVFNQFIAPRRYGRQKSTVPVQNHAHLQAVFVQIGTATVDDL